MRNWLLVSASTVCLVGLARPAPAAAETTGFCGPICQLMKNAVTAEASPVGGQDGSAGVRSGDDSLDGVDDTNDDVDEVDDSADNSSDDGEDDSEDEADGGEGGPVQ